MTTPTPPPPPPGLPPLPPPAPAPTPAFEPAPPTAPAVPVEPHSPSPWQRRRLVVASRLLLALALVGGGAVAGWWAASERSTITSASPATSAAGEDDKGATDVRRMPDLRGLTIDQARTVLVDAGVPSDNITSETVPAAGSTGLVVAQAPEFGAVVEGTVLLNVSTAAKVPSFTGKTTEAVLKELDELGAQVRTLAIYVPDADPGDIVSISPKPGSALTTTEVTVTTAASASSLALRDVEAVESSCGTDEASIGGTTYPEVISCSADSDSDTQAWVLNGAASRLTGTLGVPAEADDDDRSPVAYEIIVFRQGNPDGTVLQSGQVTFNGRPATLDLDLRRAVRLEIRYRATSEETYGWLGMADLSIWGGSDQLNALVAP